ncbi:MAG: 1-deoxy-D-xylulose-5-phosphate reductoisomerase [Deltaproteobacteria bacterium RIFOXYD12_FULL_57_12]|nr:MAG: 1-deoxy-D-xylulose-5-phosphate reductoisomerase [Deltaproteobacteria bacterium RIFOXYD12_FULL_57_12]
MAKNIAILGSTGSIGRNALDVISQFPEQFRVVGLAAGDNIALLREQILAWQPRLVSVRNEKLAADLIACLPAGWGEKVAWGPLGNERVASLAEADMVVSAIVGAAGLLPTLAAIRSGKDVALANKETLVMAGPLVMEEVRQHQVRLLPVDSEHSAVAQAMAGGRRQDVANIILTASGGPFRELPAAQLWDVTPAQALHHPNWNMGRKISIDSATLMNKGLEVIEARWLFDLELEQIKVVVHPQSIIHSLVEFVDGSVLAQMGVPDMRVPISYALSYPERLATELARLDLLACQALSFQSPDLVRFPALAISYEACRQGGTMPAMLNAANEEAVAAFLAGRIRFPEITQVVQETLRQSPRQEALDVQAVINADQAARKIANAVVDIFADAWLASRVDSPSNM